MFITYHFIRLWCVKCRRLGHRTTWFTEFSPSLSLSIFTFHWKWFGNANKIFGYSFDTSLFKINVNSDDLIRFKSASVAQLTNPFDGHLHDINKGDCFVSRTKSWIFIQFLAFFADDLIRLTFHALGLKSASDWWCQWKHLTKNSQQK